MTSIADLIAAPPASTICPVAQWILDHDERDVQAIVDEIALIRKQRSLARTANGGHTAPRLYGIFVDAQDPPPFSLLTFRRHLRGECRCGRVAT